MALLTVSCGMSVILASMAEEYIRKGLKTVAAALSRLRSSVPMLQYVHQVKARISPVSRPV